MSISGDSDDSNPASTTTASGTSTTAATRTTTTRRTTTIAKTPVDSSNCVPTEIYAGKSVIKYQLLRPLFLKHPLESVHPYAWVCTKNVEVRQNKFKRFYKISPNYITFEVTNLQDQLYSIAACTHVHYFKSIIGRYPENSVYLLTFTSICIQIDYHCCVLKKSHPFGWTDLQWWRKHNCEGILT